jgi:putative two-component system response regulator
VSLMNTKLNRRKPRVLIVDDEPANIEILQRILAKVDLPISSTTNPTKAVDLFLSQNPDLVILDLQMPVMDGFDVIAALKQVVPPESFPSVLVISGDGRATTRKHALLAGAKDFISKPFDVDDVRLRIGNLLETVELQRGQREQNELLANSLRDQAIELEESRIESVERLALMAEFRDNVSGQHNGRVARIARSIAEGIGPCPGAAELLGRVAALHDIGKIGIPDRILLKPGPLTSVEFEVMKTHTSIGARILASGRSEFMHLAEEIARCHHEKWDGSGYPLGLRGTAIPLSARIVAVADVFDALSSDRPYRLAYTIDEAHEAIEAGSGTAFDPSLVEAFRSVVSNRHSVMKTPTAERRIDVPHLRLTA